MLLLYTVVVVVGGWLVLIGLGLGLGIGICMYGWALPNAGDWTGVARWIGLDWTGLESIGHAMPGRYSYYGIGDRN